ncbi:MAG: tyrosine-type recombinase/integrase [Bacteroidetes bacterium]|nr:tyrosine-type recombinase/integrase [Bacteroidota bacterium]
MSKNMIEKAREAVEGFSGLYEKTEQRLSLTGYSDSTSENYLRELARISLQFGTIPDNLAEEQINSYLQDLATHFTKQQGTFKMAVWGLRYYFRTIKNQQTSISLPVIRHTQDLPVVLSQQECRRLFKADADLRHRLMLITMYSAGLRICELCRLKPCDIDSDRMRIHIKQSKNHKDRYVVLSSLLLVGLRKYYQQYKPEGYLFNGNRKGTPISPEGVRFILKQAVKKAGIIKPVTLHTLRHSFATHLLEEGLDLFTIKEQMGHSRIATTMTYINIAQVMPKVAFSPLDRLYTKH